MHLLQQSVILDSLHLVQQFLNHFGARSNLHVDLTNFQVETCNRLLKDLKVAFDFFSLSL
jgi:hypothetical protein